MQEFAHNEKCFTPSVRARFDALDQGELVDKLESAYSALIDRRRGSVEYGNPATITERARATANCQVLQQTLLHRAERLMVSSGTMISEQNSYGLMLMVRGHFEAMTALGYLCNRVQSLNDGNVEFDVVIMNIAQVMMGAKHELFARAPDPINIMTFIEKTDRYIERIGISGGKGMIADCYAWLSEFAHPNFNSNDGAIRLTDGNRMVFRHGEELSEAELMQLGYLDISAQLFLRLFDDLSESATIAFSP